MKHFIVWRDSSGPRRIDVYNADEESIAVGVYGVAEDVCQPEEEVCLFGSDSLATLCRTHADWLAPETINAEPLLDTPQDQEGQ